MKLRQLRLTGIPEDSTQEETSTIVNAAAGAVWLADGVHGIRVYQSGQWQTFRPRELPQNALVCVLAGDPQSELWIGTLGDGLYGWQAGSLQRWSQREGLSDSAIQVLCTDEGEGVWIGTRNGGLNHLQGGKVRRIHTP